VDTDQDKAEGENEIIITRDEDFVDEERWWVEIKNAHSHFVQEQHNFVILIYSLLHKNNIDTVLSKEGIGIFYSI
jgi:hypothetical protein